MPRFLWKLLNFNNRLSGPVQRVHIPFNIYGDFNINYLVYDKNGHVRAGVTKFRQALQIRSKQTPYINRIYNTRK